MYPSHNYTVEAQDSHLCLWSNWLQPCSHLRCHLASILQPLLVYYNHAQRSIILLSYTLKPCMTILGVLAAFFLLLQDGAIYN